MNKAPLWQSLLTTVIGAAVSALLNHFVGPNAAALGAGATATAALLKQSPLPKQ
jgi:uncharacterized membrane protein YgaE (UPF0421/DUF939 family)